MNLEYNVARLVFPFLPPVLLETQYCLKDCLISLARVVEMNFSTQIEAFDSSNTQRVLRDEKTQFERKKHENTNGLTY